MREKTLEAYDRVVSILEGATDYVPAKKLAKQCSVSTASIYMIVGLMRDNGIGVIARHVKGYILAEFASKQDDVHFSRRLNSQYARACIAMQAAAPHITKRWKGEERKFFTQMTSAFLSPQPAILRKNNDQLLQLTSRLGI
jgi:biotin operon repressor